MKKAVTIAALASLALATSNFDHDDEFMTFQAQTYLAENPQILRDAIKTVRNLNVKKFDDDELIMVGGCIPPRRIPSQNSTIPNFPKKPFGPNPSWGKPNPAWEKPLSPYPLGFSGKTYPKNPVSSVPVAQQQDDELIMVGGCTRRPGQKIPFGPSIPVIKEQDDELFNIGGLINDGVNIYKDVKTHNYGGLINHGIQTVKDIKRHDDNDDEFFSRHKNDEHFKQKQRLEDEKKALRIVQKIMDEHKNQAKKTIENLRDDEDDEFYTQREEAERKLKNQRDMERYISNTMKRQKQMTQAVLGNTKSKNIKNSKTSKTSRKDDEDYEFYSQEASQQKLKTITNFVKQAMEVVKGNPNQDQQKLAKQFLNQNAGLTKFLATLRDDADDDELFMAGNGGCIRRPQKGPLSGLKKPFGPSVPVPQQFDDEELFNLGGLINDGLNIYKDVKTHNYGELVNHGVQTVKDIKQATHGKRFLGH